MTLLSSAPSICFVAIDYPPDVGGVARSAERLVGYLTEAGFRVRVFAPRNSHRVAQPGAEGATAHRVPGMPRLANVLVELRAAIGKAHDKDPFDLFHAFYLTTALATAPVARRAARPLLISICGSDVNHCLADPMLRAMAPPVLRRAAWVTSVAADRLRLAQGLANLSGRCSVIPSSVCPAPPPAWCLTEANRGVVGTVGEFRPVKDVPLLIDAYAGLPVELRRRLRLVGDFTSLDERRRTEELLDRSGIADQVELTGFLANADVTEALRTLHVYALSSHWEGMPNALMEAAAVGVPLVATAVGAIPDVFRDGEEALLVPPHDVLRLRKALTAVLSDPELAERLSHGARRAAERLRPEHERAAWLALYRQLLAQQHP